MTNPATTAARKLAEQTKKELAGRAYEEWLKTCRELKEEYSLAVKEATAVRNRKLIEAKELYNKMIGG